MRRLGDASRLLWFAAAVGGVLDMDEPARVRPGSVTVGNDTYALPARWVIEAIDGGVVDVSRNGLVSNATGFYGFGRWYWKGPRPAAAPATVDSPVLSLVQIFDNHFQHIVFDTLPKMTAACPFLAARPDVRVLVMNDVMRDLVVEACPALGPERCFSSASPVRAPVVYLPVTDTVHAMGLVPPNSVPSLRAPSPRARGPPPTDAVFVARHRGTTRSVANEAAVLAALRERWPALRVLYPTGDWRANRAALANASVLVGPHGGAFANMVFLPENATVLEFSPVVRLWKRGENPRPCYLGLAVGLGLTYYALAPNEPFSFDGGPMTVPVDDLRALLRLI